VKARSIIGKQAWGDYIILGNKLNKQQRWKLDHGFYLPTAAGWQWMFALDKK